MTLIFLRWLPAAAAAAMAVCFFVEPAAAELAGGPSAVACRTVRGVAPRHPCGPVYRGPVYSGGGTHAYDRWDDGSMARSGRPPGAGFDDSFRFFRGYNSAYGFGR